MIQFAKKNNKNKKVTFINSDVSKVKLKKSDLIICYYTMQFIKPKQRVEILKKIYKSLNWGGGFIMFEKGKSSRC